MFNATLLALTGTTSAAQSWQAIFEYYNRTARQLDHRGYQPGEVVAIKINLNNSDAAKADIIRTSRRKWSWPPCANW